MYSKRIESIAEVVSPCDTLADIGCDHGFIGFCALEKNKAKKVLFSDISAPSLEKAKAYCLKNGCSEKCEFFVGNGTEKIAYADCVVIAGMGGKEIIEILENMSFKPSQIVLQPMKNLPDVRKYVEQRYFVSFDKIVFDKKFYNIISLTQGSDNLSDEEILFGKNNLKEKHADFKLFVEKEILKTKKILSGKTDNKDKKLYLMQLQKIAEELNYDGTNAQISGD